MLSKTVARWRHRRVAVCFFPPTCIHAVEFELAFLPAEMKGNSFFFFSRKGRRARLTTCYRRPRCARASPRSSRCRPWRPRRAAAAPCRRRARSGLVIFTHFAPSHCCTKVAPWLLWSAQVSLNGEAKPSRPSVLRRAGSRLMLSRPSAHFLARDDLPAADFLRVGDRLSGQHRIVDAPIVEDLAEFAGRRLALAGVDDQFLDIGRRRDSPRRCRATFNPPRNPYRRRLPPRRRCRWVHQIVMNLSIGNLALTASLMAVGFIAPQPYITRKSGLSRRMSSHFDD